ncbi:hypothetical protein EI94DRAFT_1814382 [Lactarius quietus]|nr:hypothetical protein EI94DRAFT_1814382 [Lactarius quietus]
MASATDRIPNGVVTPAPSRRVHGPLIVPNREWSSERASCRPSLLPLPPYVDFPIGKQQVRVLSRVTAQQPLASSPPALPFAPQPQPLAFVAWPPPPLDSTTWHHHHLPCIPACPHAACRKAHSVDMLHTISRERQSPTSLVAPTPIPRKVGTGKSTRKHGGVGQDLPLAPPSSNGASA